jgi:hypothetical protein
MRASHDVNALLKATETSTTWNQTAPQPESLLCAQNTNFCAYLTTANRLRYWSAGLAQNQSDAEFLFHDPQRSGPVLLRGFNAGSINRVNVRILFEVRGYLLSEVERLGNTLAEVDHVTK